MHTHDLQTEFPAHKVRFHSDGLRLSGTLHLPQTPRPPVVIGCHGLMSDSRSPKQVALAHRCNQNGLAFLRFDHRGCGASEGLFNEVTTLEARCNDLIDAINMIKDRSDVRDEIGLFGSSFGGTVCLAVAARRNIHPLVTFAAPIRSDFIRTLRQSADDPHVAPRIFDTRQLQFDLTPELRRISAIYMLHGQNDETVPVAHAHEIYAAVASPKKLTLQLGGDHRMSDPSFQKAFIGQAADWLKAGLQGKAL